MKDYILKITKNPKLVMVIILFLIIIIVFFFLHNYFKHDEVIITNENSEDKWNSISFESFAKKDGVIVVDVVGEVNNPGVVTLNEGARIIDAINAAGGKTDKADLSEINLAYVLDDGIKLYIPSYSEVKERKMENTSNSVKETVTDGVGVDNIVVESPTTEKKGQQNNKININKATLEELKQLPGVGDSVAKAIIDYRNKNGKFNKIDDLKQVSGIGQSKFDNIKELIVVK